MANQSSPSVTSSLPAALILSIGGWGGVWYLSTQTLPTLWPRWFFFAAIIVAMAGTSIPFIAFLNWRFPTAIPVTFSVIVREALEVGVYAATLLWLNKGNVLNTGLALVLGLGLLFAEALLRLRAQSQWRPGKNDS